MAQQQPVLVPAFSQTHPHHVFTSKAPPDRCLFYSNQQRSWTFKARHKAI
jgi:hypothetical protein